MSNTYNTTNTAPAFMLAAGTVAVDAAGNPWVVARVGVDEVDGDILAYFNNVNEEHMRFYPTQAVTVMPDWEYALLTENTPDWV